MGLLKKSRSMKGRRSEGVLRSGEVKRRGDGGMKEEEESRRGNEGMKAEEERRGNEGMKAEEERKRGNEGMKMKEEERRRRGNEGMQGEEKMRRGNEGMKTGEERRRGSEGMKAGEVKRGRSEATESKDAKRRKTFEQWAESKHDLYADVDRYTSDRKRGIGSAREYGEWAGEYRRKCEQLREMESILELQREEVASLFARMEGGKGRQGGEAGGREARNGWAGDRHASAKSREEIERLVRRLYADRRQKTLSLRAAAVALHEELRAMAAAGQRWLEREKRKGQRGTD